MLSVRPSVCDAALWLNDMSTAEIVRFTMYRRRLSLRINGDLQRVGIGLGSALGLGIGKDYGQGSIIFASQSHEQ